MSQSAEDNPDGALAKYLWLWQSMGRRPGRRLIPRPIRFFFAASVDLFSLGAWYVRKGILRVARSARSKEAMMIVRTKQVAGLTIVAGVVIGALLMFRPLVLWSPAVVHTPVVRAWIAPPVAPSAPAEEPASGQASGFDLQQNYPNPFNPETTIPFILHEGLFAEGRPTLVSIHIFNRLLQLVASPVALRHSSGEGAELIQLEYAQPGAYEAFWDGTDLSGRQVASGVYFTQMNVNGLPRKMARLFKRY